QADGGDPLRRGDADLARAEGGVGGGVEPGLDDARLAGRPVRVAGTVRGAFDLFDAEHLAGEPGTLAEQGIRTGEVAPAAPPGAAGERQLGRLPALDRDRLAPADHRVGRLAPGRQGPRPR